MTRSDCRWIFLNKIDRRSWRVVSHVVGFWSHSHTSTTNTVTDSDSTLRRYRANNGRDLEDTRKDADLIWSKTYWGPEGCWKVQILQTNFGWRARTGLSHDPKKLERASHSYECRRWDFCRPYRPRVEAIPNYMRLSIYKIEVNSRCIHSSVTERRIRRKGRSCGEQGQD